MQPLSLLEIRVVFVLNLAVKPLRPALRTDSGLSHQND